MAHVDFWYEFASTYSYPAAMRIEALAAERGVDVGWRPFLLGPIFAGPRLAQFAVQYLSRQGPLHVARHGAHLRALGLPLQRPRAVSAE